MRKMLVSDYDRTFYISDDDVKKNIKNVNCFRSKGNIFAIATGRSYFDLKKKTEKYNILYDYAILNHGTIIIDENDNIIYNNTINDDIINELKNEIYLERAVSYFCCSGLNSRLDINHHNLNKIYVEYESNDFASKIKMNIVQKFSKYVKVYYAGKGNIIEIISKNDDKSKSIKKIVEITKIMDNNVYTIGDGENDIDMLKDYNGYSMENSFSELKDYSIRQYKSVSNLIEDLLNDEK